MTPILCPHTQKGLHPSLKKVLESCGYPIIWLDVTDDNWGYERAFRKLWLAGEDFAIFEHDMVPTVEQIRELIECPDEWCSVAYCHPWTRAKNGWTKFHAFGGVRFRKSMMVEHPELISKMMQPDENGQKFSRWIQMDSRFNTVANRAGCKEHQHTWNVVTHWHWSVEHVVMDGSSQEQWESDHEMPWDVVYELNRWNSGVTSDPTHCRGHVVSVHHCRPRPGELVIVDQSGQVVWDSRKLSVEPAWLARHKVGV